MSLQSLENEERKRCPKAGTAGHHGCGICAVHNKPRFECGCLYFKERDDGN